MTREGLAELDADGCGMLHYPSGNVLAVVSRVNGGKYTQFFDDTETSGKQVLAAFNFAGIGFANYRSGAPRVVTTKTGVVVLDEDGTMAHDYRWDHMAPDATPLPSPVEFNLNAILSFQCHSLARIQVTLLRGRHYVFDVGRTTSRPDSYLDNVLRHNVDGSLVLDIHAPTLVQRQLAFQVADPVKKAQRYNWALPRLSSSGREAARVRPRAQLQAVMDAHAALVDRLHSFSTSITANVADERQRQRAIPSHSFFSPISKPCVVPRANVKRPVVVPKHLPRLHPQHLDQLLATAKSTQLVVVLCSTLSTSDCVAAEKMLAKFEHDWAVEEAQLAAARPLPVAISATPDVEPIPIPLTTKGCPPRGKTAGSKVPPAKATPAATTPPALPPATPDTVATSLPAAITPLPPSDSIDPAPERSQSTRRILLVDCSTSTLLARWDTHHYVPNAVVVPSRRHNFSVYPMYLMYYGGHLGFCSNVLNGFGRTDVDFLLQVKTTMRNCQRNKFLPVGFRFP
ncbi:hypothetical protein, variant 1 [Aphanomyces invadans]|uniref:FAM194 C-terminal domain-containing protein n=1 Tax=Aphanomyces invadans TaxID=157072 RepID=A0A024UK63_9STRA|nr:hypothetical protein, variant 1 [Aphanomyces invadans]ETW06252.1 hypothetical protein, variant 1 [Aphanomyces invadans]|eukprot:XP_008864327.1 hypothetical protein, variant 1 [Aphanomyces invadans]